jgi:hypothetical protein
VDSVILAVDNFSQPVLDRYRKLTSVAQNLESIRILHSLDIDAYLDIIMFDPWTTLGELLENFEVMREIPYLRPWQILSKLEIYHGSPITLELEELNLLQWDGYNARYQYQDDRIQNVYLAIETIMKVLHPSLSELDRFRWGNLGYTDVDAWILKNNRERLIEINTDYNRRALDLAIEIVKRQQTSSAPLSPLHLADSRLLRDAEILNELTLREVAALRNDAKSQIEDSNKLPVTVPMSDVK